ncbi:YaaC family protein [Bacillus sp. FJAT-50079]|uniref:YaaC family protein n=1 Tax=Bacillus sp. FJAT-50079 TaxID=2833577 RepID=UPI001BC9DD4D|nr:YaaC family protein [Bacillus sp. FJAT-50079]MBS4210761.1 YaaC family protein [Bacillus sp. FJAT-50079]
MFHFSNNLEVKTLNHIKQVWKRINFFQSAEMTEHYLKNTYKNLPNAHTKNYDNCYPFMYYLEQGEIFYKQANDSPLSIKPMLLFYGLVHLIKACLLTVDPFYPNSTSVLAHGVSARKRKKRDYLFFDDEIKIQRNGICTYFSEKMFHVKHLEGEKFKMGELLSLVAELDDVFSFVKGESTMVPFDDGIDAWIIPKEVAQSYFIDEKRLKELLNNKYPGNIDWKKNHSNTLLINKREMYHPPFRYHFDKQQLCLPNKFHQHDTLPDMLIHYLLLYNLSMISRYETEWWFEQLKTTPNSDMIFIQSFLDVTERKGPYLIYQFLMERMK